MDNMSPCDAQQVLAYKGLSRGRAVSFECDSFMTIRLLLDSMILSQMGSRVVHDQCAMVKYTQLCEFLERALAALLVAAAAMNEIELVFGRVVPYQRTREG